MGVVYTVTSFKKKQDIFNILRFVRRVYIFYTPLLSYIFFIKIFLAHLFKKIRGTCEPSF